MDNKTKEIRRVTDEEAQKLIEKKTHTFVAKKIWKEKVRGPVTIAPPKPKKKKDEFILNDVEKETDNKQNG
jgi:hypothetical protein